MENVRTRFAPSPTGYMHIGNLRSALFAYLTAKSMKGSFILRIEDTDQKRKVEGATEFIYNTLNLCGLKIDEGAMIGGPYGPYFQSERLDIYKKYAEDLIKIGKAYYCFCTEERLENLREVASLNKVPFLYDGHCKNLTQEEITSKIASGEKYVIRQAIEKTGTTSYDDTVYGKIEIENKYLEDQILIKSDGFPTYNFANVIDDHLMQITHINRGCEYLSSTPKYLQLYQAFGWKSPIYIHQPLVIKADGTKISKRNKDDNLMDLINAGFLIPAIINYLALIGWSPKDNREIFTLKELEENFDITRINNAPGCYDINKLKWFNGHYIKQLNDNEYLEFIIPFLKETYDITQFSTTYINHLLLIYKNSISYGREISTLCDLFFKDEISYNEECIEFLKQDTISNTLEIFKENIKNIKNWNIESIKEALNNTKEKANVKGKMLYMPIRIKISGQMHGPELPDTIYLLGKQKIISRLD